MTLLALRLMIWNQGANEQRLKQGNMDLQRAYFMVQGRRVDKEIDVALREMNQILLTIDCATNRPH